MQNHQPSPESRAKLAAIANRAEQRITIYIEAQHRADPELRTSPALAEDARGGLPEPEVPAFSWTLGTCVVTGGAALFEACSDVHSRCGLRTR